MQPVNWQRSQHNLSCGPERDHCNRVLGRQGESLGNVLQIERSAVADPVTSFLGKNSGPTSGKEWPVRDIEMNFHLACGIRHPRDGCAPVPL